MRERDLISQEVLDATISRGAKFVCKEIKWVGWRKFSNGNRTLNLLEALLYERNNLILTTSRK